MDRRSFIRGALSIGAGITLGVGHVSRSAHADPPINDKRVLLSMTLDGGPDFRHLIVPPFDPNPGSYGYAYWSARFRSHGLAESADAWQNRYLQDYTQVKLGGVTFGVLSSAGWLISRLTAGKAAIINNVLASTTRDHHHSVLVYESGDRSTGPNDMTRDGWGGRLAQAISGNVVSMTGHVRLFCNGKHPSDPLQHDNRNVITAADTRDIALFRPDDLDEDPASRSSQAIMSRALTGYYAAKARTIAAESPYRRVIEHEKAIRAFGDLINARLASIEIPPALAALYDGDSTLNNTGFGKQLRNVYDSFACSDILGFRVGSLMYDGWDSHRGQLDMIEPKLEDMFGAGRGLDVLFSSLQAAMPDAYANAVLVIGGEFGRQLRDNGDNGTDHGRGNSMLVIGDAVRGGLYGELFPEEEIPLYAEPNKDINGKTAIERVFAELCDHVSSGTGDIVFPNHGDAGIENGADLSTLFGTA